MAIIQRGSFGEFSASADDPRLSGLGTLSELSEVRRDARPVRVKFHKSRQARGLALKSLKLEHSFEGFLAKLFKRKSEVYILVWCWDMSGVPIVQYPATGVQRENVIIPLKAGHVRAFLGAGTVLFPARPVTGGLAVRINIWESDQGARQFGTTLSDVTQEIQESKLNNLLKLLALAGPHLATLTLIKDAALELTDAVGTILKANGDDYVDFYEGYYPSADRWSAGDEKHRGYASEITLSRMK